MFIKIPPADLVRLTNAHHERNMYAHPNPVARGIFWQRLEVGYRLLRDVPAGSKVLDLGGGERSFSSRAGATFRGCLGRGFGPG